MNMIGNIHDGLSAYIGFRKIGDECIPVVVPPPSYLGILADVFPLRLDGRNGPCWIAGVMPPKRNALLQGWRTMKFDLS